MEAVEYLRAKETMCEYESERACSDCPIFLLMKEVRREDEVCDNFDVYYPKECVAGVVKWMAQHPALPTWREWLHYVYHYYKGFRTSSTMEDWLDTPVTEELAKKYNIPYRRDIE